MTSVFDSAAFNQNLFFPRPDFQPCPAGAEDFLVEVCPGVRVHARRHPSPDNRFSLLFFHGNGEIAADYDELAPMFADLGADFFVLEYRGYGKSEGSPSLRDALADAHHLYNFFKNKELLRPQVCVMGRSLGSAAAIELCAHYREITCGLIESGFADPIPLVERRGLSIDSTTPEEEALFNNSLKIKKVRCPLLILHGGDDVLIPPAEAELNHRQAGSKVKKLCILEGVGHNDIFMAPRGGYFGALREFFQEVLE